MNDNERDRERVIRFLWFLAGGLAFSYIESIIRAAMDVWMTKP